MWGRELTLCRFKVPRAKEVGNNSGWALHPWRSCLIDTTGPLTLYDASCMCACCVQWHLLSFQYISQFIRTCQHVSSLRAILNSSEGLQKSLQRRFYVMIFLFQPLCARLPPWPLHLPQPACLIQPSLFWSRWSSCNLSDTEPGKSNKGSLVILSAL